MKKTQKTIDNKPEIVLEAIVNLSQDIKKPVKELTLEYLNYRVTGLKSFPSLQMLYKNHEKVYK